MASRRLEDLHELLLSKILSQSGLECSKSLDLSQESEEASGEIEEQVPVAEEETNPESQLEEEHPMEMLNEAPEEVPNIFPTPSLRKMLPDHIRQIQELNRIHVLPEVFKTHIDPALIPKIAATPPDRYIEVLAELVGCSKYRSSLAEYWFLDTMANLLRRAQDDELNRPTQGILMLWFCEWMKEMQNFDAADRHRMMRRFEDNMLATARFVAVTDELPTPQEVEVDYKETILETPATTPGLVLTPNNANANQPVPPSKTKIAQSPSKVAQSPSEKIVTFEGSAFSCALIDLAYIIHYIYDLFNTDYQYNLIRSVFTFSPDYILIDTPYQLHVPKRLYAPLKPLKKEKSPKKEKDKAKTKGKKDAPDPIEYLELLAKRAAEERQLEEQEELERELWNQRCSILPLQFAATQELFDGYWPPPPEPEQLPEPDPKKTKGKKK